MFLFLIFFRIYPLILPAILLFQVGDKTAAYHVSQQAVASSEALPVSMVIWTDRAKYSLRDGIKVTSALQNNGEKPWYVDRRPYLDCFHHIQLRHDQQQRQRAEHQLCGRRTELYADVWL